MPPLSGAESGFDPFPGDGVLSSAYTAAARRFHVLAEDWLIMRALILRSLRVRHTGNPLGIFVEVFRPLAICTAHYFYFSLMQRSVPGYQYAIFTVGGFSIWFTFQMPKLGPAMRSIYQEKGLMPEIVKDFVTRL